MLEYAWRISLRPHLSDEQKALSPYAIADELGMSKNTVIKYMENDEVITTRLAPSVHILADYFGLNVFDIVSVVDESEEGDDEPQGQIKTAQLA